MLYPELEDLKEKAKVYLEKYPTAKEFEPGWYRDEEWWKESISYTKKSYRRSVNYII